NFGTWLGTQNPPDRSLVGQAITRRSTTQARCLLRLSGSRMGAPLRSEQVPPEPSGGCCRDRSIAPAVGDRLGDEAVANVARVGVPDRPFGCRDRHPLDTLDVLGDKVGVVDDEPGRYLPPDAHRGPAA